VTRKIAKSLPTTCYFTKSGENKYDLVTELPMKTYVQPFSINQETDFITIDGRNVKNLFHYEGRFLVEQQTDENRTIVIKREFIDNKMLSEISVNNIKTKCLLELIE
jgi:hypothetical protein